MRIYNDIMECRVYILKSIEQKMILLLKFTKKKQRVKDIKRYLSKDIAALACFDKILLDISATSGSVSIASFSMLLVHNLE